MKFIQRCTQITVLPEGEPIFSEMATEISIVNEAGGEFIQIKQTNDHAEPGVVTVDGKDWPVVKDAIETMFKEIKRHETKGKPD